MLDVKDIRSFAVPDHVRAGGKRFRNRVGHGVIISAVWWGCGLWGAVVKSFGGGDVTVMVP